MVPATGVATTFSSSDPNRAVMGTPFEDGATGSSGPRPDALEAVFELRETRQQGERVRYFGESLVPEQMLIREVWPAFRDAGYEIEAARTDAGGQDVLVARQVSPGIDGIPWTNLALLLATLTTTLLVGATAWYYVPAQRLLADPLAALQAWPFVAAVLGVLLVHELGHYVAGRYHGVDVSLPYLIPFVMPFGTMGALIRIRGQLPDRKALFDVGVAGPLAGLVATVVVTVIGLSISPHPVPESVAQSTGEAVVFNDPPLLALIGGLIGEPTSYAAPSQTVHPVVVGGWVGMFFTLLNLLPVGQLDGGHVLRAIAGSRQETIAALVPLVLFGFAGYLHVVRGFGLNDSVALWAIWGLFATALAYNGPADPIDDEPLGRRRIALGLVTYLLGALCFMLVPVQVVSV
jgi:membrane-associated protease RseP (regulator of RpoE activity)